MTDIQDNNAKIDMETEESKLLRMFREKYKRRENERARREARIEHLKQLIEEMPDSDEIPSEEDRRIEKEIDEAQKLINARDQTKTIFRIPKGIYDQDGNKVATFDATVNLKTDPTRMRADKQAIFVAVLMKNREVKFETKLMGDVDLDIVKGIQFKIPPEPSREEPVKIRPEVSAETAVPKAGTRTVATNVPRREGKSPTTTLPEETFGFDTESTSQEASNLREEAESQNTITPTPEPKTYQRKRSTTKRQQKKRKVYSSDSQTENSEEERERKESVTRKRQRRDTSTPKTRAKDGRKLVDLTNRIRDEKGRLLGYKPGLQPAKIQSKKPKIKMPTISPPPATPELQVGVRRLAERQSQSLEIEPTLRPTVDFCPEEAPQREQENGHPEGRSQQPILEAEGETDVVVPAMQPLEERTTSNPWRG